MKSSTISRVILLIISYMIIGAWSLVGSPQPDPSAVAAWVSSSSTSPSTSSWELVGSGVLSSLKKHPPNSTRMVASTSLSSPSSSSVSSSSSESTTTTVTITVYPTPSLSSSTSSESTTTTVTVTVYPTLFPSPPSSSASSSSSESTTTTVTVTVYPTPSPSLEARGVPEVECIEAAKEFYCHPTQRPEIFICENVSYHEEVGGANGDISEFTCQSGEWRVIDGFKNDRPVWKDSGMLGTLTRIPTGVPTGNPRAETIQTIIYSGIPPLIPPFTITRTIPPISPVTKAIAENTAVDISEAASTAQV